MCTQSAVCVPEANTRLRREQLACEITELAANINAATYRLLTLIEKFDRRKFGDSILTLPMADGSRELQRGPRLRSSDCMRHGGK